MAFGFSVLPASGQYYNNPNSDVSQARNKVPLNQLPPIVSSPQATTGNSMLQPAKKLLLPEQNNSLPPILTPGQVSQPVFTPPITKPSVPSTLPPIVSPGNKFVPAKSVNSPPPIIPGTPRPEQPTLSKAGVPYYSNMPNSNATGNQPLPFGNSSFPKVNNGGPAIVNGVPTIISPRRPVNNSPVPSAINGRPKPNATRLPVPSFNGRLVQDDEIPSLPDVEIDEPGSVMDLGPAPSTTESGIPPAAPVVGSPGTNDFFENGTTGIATNYDACGLSGCYDPAMIQAQNGCCGSVANAGYYLFADALFWTRADGDVQLSNFFGLNDWNFVGGWRFTLGQRENSTQGRELVFWGTGDLDETETFNSTGGSLDALFTATGGLGFAEVSSFFGATTQTQSKETQLQNIELNRIKWGWDVLKSFIGFRYIYFDDSYELFSSNGTTNGLFVQDIVNNLFGIHGGWELFYDVGYRTSASLTSKFGAYINATNADTRLFNGGVQNLSQETDEGSIASTMEFGAMSHFQLSPRSRLRLGDDIFLMWGAHTVENNIPRNTFARGFQTGTPVISPATGTNLNTSNEPVLFHGLSFGFEIFR
ncbi:MAG: hypothetical protein AAGA30_06290 [Planctomycetota bacterium]